MAGLADLFGDDRLFLVHESREGKNWVSYGNEQR